MTLYSFMIPPSPPQCQAVEGMRTHQVACGMGLTMFLVDSEAAGEERIAKIPVFESSAPETEAAVEEAAAGVRGMAGCACVWVGGGM